MFLNSGVDYFDGVQGLTFKVYPGTTPTNGSVAAHSTLPNSGSVYLHFDGSNVMPTQVLMSGTAAGGYDIQGDGWSANWQGDLTSRSLAMKGTALGVAANAMQEFFENSTFVDSDNVRLRRLPSAHNSR